MGITNRKDLESGIKHPRLYFEKRFRKSVLWNIFWRLKTIPLHTDYTQIQSRRQKKDEAIEGFTDRLFVLQQYSEVDFEAQVIPDLPALIFFK